jgi:hypothetical protein
MSPWESCFPVFTADHVPELIIFLDERIHGGDSGGIAATIEQSKYRPSKKLLDHVSRLIKGKPEYVLLDEQLVVYDKVVEAATDGAKGKKKVAITLPQALQICVTRMGVYFARPSQG